MELCLAQAGERKKSEKPSRVTPHAAATKAPKDARPPMFCGVPMKWLSLVALTLQTSAQVFVIKCARGRDGAASSRAYLASTVVLLSELVKVVVSFLLLARESGGVRAATSKVRSGFVEQPWEVLKLGVPCLLYTIQNNLMFFSLDKLSAAVQQVTYQLKILTTAVFSVTILGKALGPTKWVALCVLLVGIALVQSPADAAGAAQKDGHSAVLGFLAVLAACCTSGLAGVYMEAILKKGGVSIWMRNIQLGLFGCLASLLTVFASDGAQVAEAGFFQGYSWRVICVVFNNALGGLLCAAVLKYADNILRCFSVALSIILTSGLSWVVLHEFEPSGSFVLGAFLAVSSTFLYNLGLPSRGSFLFKEPRSPRTLRTLNGKS